MLLQGMDLPSYDQAKARIFPRLRHKSYISFAELQCRAEGVPVPAIPYRSVTPHWSFELCFEPEEGFDDVISISQEDLNAWQRSFEQVWADAEANLLARSGEEFLSMQIGLHLSSWQDDHDASRLALTELIRGLKVKGDTLVLAPSRSVLFVTGTEDFEAQATMLKMAAEHAEDEDAVAMSPLYFSGQGWKEWQPEQNNPNRGALLALQGDEMVALYDSQQELLQEIGEKEEDLPFAASLGVFESESGEVLNCSSWTQGVATLLPASDVISFLRFDPGATDPEEPSEMVVVHWHDVVAIVGDTMKPQGWYPERWLVEKFPTGETWQALLDKAIFVDS